MTTDSRSRPLLFVRVVLLALNSPRFLYHEVDEGLDAYDVASRISFALWDSLPDDELRGFEG